MAEASSPTYQSSLIQTLRGATPTSSVASPSINAGIKTWGIPTPTYTSPTTYPDSVTVDATNNNTSDLLFDPSFIESMGEPFDYLNITSQLNNPENLQTPAVNPADYGPPSPSGGSSSDNGSLQYTAPADAIQVESPIQEFDPYQYINATVTPYTGPGDSVDIIDPYKYINATVTPASNSAASTPSVNDSAIADLILNTNAIMNLPMATPSVSPTGGTTLKIKPLQLK
ncbi:MAG: hypothetical protein VW518_00190 [Burkholderiaceae bacterium]